MTRRRSASGPSPPTPHHVPGRRPTSRTSRTPTIRSATSRHPRRRGQQNVVFFRNQRVEPSADYTYDAIYRLIAATGREHLGQTRRPCCRRTGHQRRLVPHGPAAARRRQRDGHLHRDLRLRRGRQSPVDAPRGEPGNWTRHYAYGEPSHITAAETDNRLTATSVPGDPAAGPYTPTTHDEHGNMTRMPHLPL